MRSAMHCLKVDQVKLTCHHRRYSRALWKTSINLINYLDREKSAKLKMTKEGTFKHTPPPVCVWMCLLFFSLYWALLVFPACKYEVCKYECVNMKFSRPLMYYWLLKHFSCYCSDKVSRVSTEGWLLMCCICTYARDIFAQHQGIQSGEECPDIFSPQIAVSTFLQTAQVSQFHCKVNMRWQENMCMCVKAHCKPIVVSFHFTTWQHAGNTALLKWLRNIASNDVYC